MYNSNSSNTQRTIICCNIKLFFELHHKRLKANSDEYKDLYELGNVSTQTKLDKLRCHWCLISVTYIIDYIILSNYILKETLAHTYTIKSYESSEKLKFYRETLSNLVCTSVVVYYYSLKWKLFALFVSWRRNTFYRISCIGVKLCACVWNNT